MLRRKKEAVAAWRLPRNARSFLQELRDHQVKSSRVKASLHDLRGYLGGRTRTASAPSPTARQQR